MKLPEIIMIKWVEFQICFLIIYIIPKVSRGSFAMKHNKLLVVDDEETVLSVLKNYLARETSFDCKFASSAEEALQIFAQEPVDVILTDLKMPGMSGLDLVNEIKERKPDAAIIIMSGYGEMEDVIIALRHGVVDFFQKPFKMQTVLECLRRTFHRVNIECSLIEAGSFLLGETKKIVIPNNFDAANQVTIDLTKNLVKNGFTDEVQVESIRVALSEIIINGIEHGNLEVSYEEKNKRIDNFESYSTFLDELANKSDFKKRKVEIEYTFTRDFVRFVIRDEGNGFDHTNLPDPTDPMNLMNSHGRGILMTRIYMDEVTFNDKGNEATLIKYVSKIREPATAEV